MTTDEALHLFAAIRAGYPGTTIETATVALYVKALERHEYADGMRAVEILLDNERYWPTLAVIRTAIRDARAERQRQLPPAVEAPPTAEEREQAAALGRELANRLRGIPEDTPVTVEGDTPEIAAARRRVAEKLAAEESSRNE